MRGADTAAPGRAFAVASAAIAASLLALCLWVAAHEWFSRDDFAFLAMARDDSRSWLDVYLPLGERAWRFYRPLGGETFFRVGVAWFGLEPLGFFAAVLAVHSAGGLVAWRLARQLGFAAPVAIATALFAVSRPSLAELFYGSMFQNVALAFLSAAFVSLFLDASRRAGAARQVGSCVVLVLALLCHESAVVLPLVGVVVAALADRRGVRGLAPLARRALPHAAIVAAYLVFRFGVLSPFESRGRLYELFVGGHAVRNLARLLRGELGGDVAQVAVGAFVAAVLVTTLARDALRVRVGAQLVATAGACVGWACLALAPFVLLPFVHPRFGVVVAVPSALAVGAAANALWWIAPEPRRPLFAAGLLAAVVASAPVAALLEVAAHPSGAFPRRLVEFVRANELDRRESARLVVLYGGEGLADAERARTARYLIYGGGIFRAISPTSRTTVRFHDLREPPPRGVVTPASVYAVLLPDLTLAPADASRIPR